MSAVNGGDGVEGLGMPDDYPLRCVFLVEGAGMREVNGVYEQSGERSDGWWTYTFANNGRIYVLYRYRDAVTNLKRWRLALKPDGEAVGLHEENDYYLTALSRDHVYAPDFSRWSRCRGVLGPAPRVMLNVSRMDLPWWL